METDLIFLRASQSADGDSLSEVDIICVLLMCERSVYSLSILRPSAEYNSPLLGEIIHLLTIWLV